jgi:hypothetical protein
MGNKVEISLSMTDLQKRDLLRFFETSEDGQGYDVPKDRMKSLARVGLIRSLGFSRYEITDAGDLAIECCRNTGLPGVIEATSNPAEWGAPKTVRQLIQQLSTLDQDSRPLSMLRVPGDVFEDGKERTRAVHLSFSYERVSGQWLVPFKSDGEKVVAFWCRMEKPAPISE